jgi:hypothetical protein
MALHALYECIFGLSIAKYIMIRYIALGGWCVSVLITSFHSLHRFVPDGYDSQT